MKPHPIQPVEPDEHGTLRFKSNKIVEYLLANGGIDMNQIACMDFPREDREQFAQLIGYSIAGFGDLGYTSGTTYHTAYRMRFAGETPEQARIAVLEQMLTEIKDGLRIAACAAFNKHPDDLV